MDKMAGPKCVLSSEVPQ